MNWNEFYFPPQIELIGGKRFRFYKGGEAAPSNTTTQQVYSPEEQAARNRLMAEAEAIYGQQKAAAAGQYPGARPVAPGAETLQAQNMMTASATGAQTQMAGDLARATSFGLNDVLYPGSNPALQATIDTATRQIGEAYTDPGGVLSNIRSNFASGAPSGQSSREGIAMGVAGRGYLNAIGDVTGKIASAGYGQGLDFMGKTMALAPTNMQAQNMPATSLSAVGAQKDLQRQAEEDYEAAGREWKISAPSAAMQPYTNAIMGLSNPATVSTGTPATAGRNSMAPVGMAMQGAALGSMIMPGMGTAIGAGAGLLLGMFA